MRRLGTHATTIKQRGKTLTVRYHRTDIVKATPSTITLNTGGWKTVTTKTRMNQAANQFDLKYSVVQRKGTWYVRHGGKVREFTGKTIRLSRKRRRKK